MKKPFITSILVYITTFYVLSLLHGINGVTIPINLYYWPTTLLALFVAYAVLVIKQVGIAANWYRLQNSKPYNYNRLTLISYKKRDLVHCFYSINIIKICVLLAYTLTFLKP